MKTEPTFIMGYPWFRVTWLYFIDYEDAENPQCVERWLVLSNKNNYTVGSYKTRDEARSQSRWYNDWWERDYKSLNRVKGNKLWRSLVG